MKEAGGVSQVFILKTFFEMDIGVGDEFLVHEHS